MLCCATHANTLQVKFMFIAIHMKLMWFPHEIHLTWISAEQIMWTLSQSLFPQFRWKSCKNLKNDKDKVTSDNLHTQCEQHDRIQQWYI